MKSLDVWDGIPAPPLFIRGNPRVSENRQRACSLFVERELVRERFGLTCHGVTEEFINFRFSDFRLNDSCRTSFRFENH